jgi:hypothetical protein
MVIGTFEFANNAFKWAQGYIEETTPGTPVQSNPIPDNSQIAQQLRLIVAPHLAGVHSSEASFDPKLLGSENSFDNFYQNYFLPWLGTEDGLYFRNTFQDLFEDNPDNLVLAQLIFNGKSDTQLSTQEIQRQYENLLVDFVKADPKAFARAHFKTKVGQELIRQALGKLAHNEIEAKKQEAEFLKTEPGLEALFSDKYSDIREQKTSSAFWHDELSNCVADVAFEEGFIAEEQANAINEQFSSLFLYHSGTQSHKLNKQTEAIEKIFNQVNDQICELEATDKKFFETEQNKATELGQTEYGTAERLDADDIQEAKELIKKHSDRFDIRSQLITHLASAALEVANNAHWKDQRIEGPLESHNYVVEVRRDCFKMLMGRIDYVIEKGLNITWQDFLAINHNLQFYLRNKIAGPASLKESFADIYTDSIAKHKSQAFAGLLNFSDTWTVTAEFAESSTLLGFAFPFEGPITKDIEFSDTDQFSEEEEKIIRAVHGNLDQLPGTFMQGFTARVALSQKGDEFSEWLNLYVDPILFDDETIQSDYKDVYHGILCLREIQADIQTAKNSEDLQGVLDKLYAETSAGGRILKAKQAAEYDGAEVVWQSAQTAIAALAQVLILRGIGNSGLLNQLKQWGPLEKALECYAKIPASARKVFETALAGGMQNLNIMAIDQALNAVFAVKMPGAFKDVGYMLMATFTVGAVFGALFRPFMSLGLNKPLSEWTKFDFLIALPAHIGLDQAQEFAEEVFEEKVGAWLQELRHRFDPTALMNMFLSTVTGGFTQKTVTRAFTNNPLSFLFPAPDADDSETNNFSIITGLALSGILFSPLIYILSYDSAPASPSLGLQNFSPMLAMPVFLDRLIKTVKGLVGLHGDSNSSGSSPAGDKNAPSSVETNPDAVEAPTEAAPAEGDGTVNSAGEVIVFEDSVPVPDPDLAGDPSVDGPALVDDVPADSMDVDPVPPPTTAPAPAATPAAEVLAGAAEIISEVSDKVPVNAAPVDPEVLARQEREENIARWIEHARETLNLDEHEVARERFAALPRRAQIILALLSGPNQHGIPHVEASHLTDFLNHNSPEEIRESLLVVSDLYNLGVPRSTLRNFFRRTESTLGEREANTLSHSQGHIRRGVLAELRQARWYLQHIPGATLTFGTTVRTLRRDGAHSRLTDRGRTHTELDLIVNLPDGRRFSVEVKSRQSEFSLNDQQYSELFGQLRRQANVVRSRDDIQAIELVIEAGSIGRNVPRQLLNMMERLGLAYNIHLVVRGGEHQVITGSNGHAFSYDVVENDADQILDTPGRIPELIIPDAPAPSTITTTFENEITRNVWDADVRRVLGEVFNETLAAQANMTEARSFGSFRNQLRAGVEARLATPMLNHFISRAERALEIEQSADNLGALSAKEVLTRKLVFLRSMLGSRIRGKAVAQALVQAAKAIAILERALNPDQAITEEEAIFNPAQIIAIEALIPTYVETHSESLSLARETFNDSVQSFDNRASNPDFNLEDTAKELEQINELFENHNPDRPFSREDLGGMEEYDILLDIVAEDQLTIRNLVNFLETEEGQELGFSNEFVEGLRDYVTDHDTLTEEMAAFGQRIRDALEAQPVEQVYDTFPAEVLARLREEIRQRIAEERARAAAQTNPAGDPADENRDPVTEPAPALKPGTDPAPSDAVNNPETTDAVAKPKPTPETPKKRAEKILLDMASYSVEGTDTLYFPPADIQKAIKILEESGMEDDAIQEFLINTIPRNERTPVPLEALDAANLLPAGMVLARGRRITPILGTDVNINRVAERLVQAGRHDLARELPLEGIRIGRYWINWRAVREAALTDPRVAEIVFRGQLDRTQIANILTRPHHADRIELLQLLRVLGGHARDSIDFSRHGQRFVIAGRASRSNNNFTSLEIMTEEEFNTARAANSLPEFFVGFRVRNRNGNNDLRVTLQGGEITALRLALTNLRRVFDQAFSHHAPQSENSENDALMTTLGRHIIARIWRDNNDQSDDVDSHITRRLSGAAIDTHINAQIETLTDPTVMADMARLAEYLDDDFNFASNSDLYLVLGVNTRSENNNLRFYAPRFYDHENGWAEDGHSENIILRYRYDPETGQLVLQEVRTENRQRDNDPAIRELRNRIATREAVARPDAIAPGVRLRRPGGNNNGN